MNEKVKIQLKDLVKEKYGEIAKATGTSGCCCGSVSCEPAPDYSVFSEDYSAMPGYNPDADMGLGCGLPTEYAGIKPGDAVLDLGSGAGNDCFVARSLTGETGSVTGIDFTDEMLEKANANVEKLGYTNVSFVKGDIDNMPLPDNQFDVIISNCVLNLVPDKKLAFAEIHRVLKTGGHFSISDVVLQGELPESLRSSAEMYAGCVAGALQQDEYLNIIEDAGFRNIAVRKSRQISLPEEVLAQYLDAGQMKDYVEGESGIFSITVNAEK